jgi:hypothetical protein
MTERTFQIHLNSKNALLTQGSSINDCWYDIPSKNISPQNEIYISITHACFPYTWYNIHSKNNSLTIYANSFTYNIIIPQGNYNGLNLAKIISSLLPNTSGNVFNCSFDTITSKITFTLNTSFIFDETSTCLNTLGIVDYFTSSFVNSTKYILTSSQPINLIPHQCICIAVSNINTENIHVGISQHYKSVLCSIPVDVSPMGMIIYKNHNLFKVNTGENYLNQLNIKILDQDGTLIDFNGHHYSLCIQFDIINFTTG